MTYDKPTPTSDAPSDASEAFAALPPLPTAIWLAGLQRHVSVTPLRLGELPAFSAAVAPMGRALQTLLAAPQPDWLGLIATHGEHCIKALAIATRQPEPDLLDLDLADSVSLIEAVITINADFFTRQVLPRLSQATARLSSPDSTWRKPLPSSYAPGTATPTSLVTH